jgi:hypothetical protein
MDAHGTVSQNKKYKAEKKDEERLLAMALSRSEAPTHTETLEEEEKQVISELATLQANIATLEKKRVQLNKRYATPLARLVSVAQLQAQSEGSIAETISTRYCASVLQTPCRSCRVIGVLSSYEGG